MKKPKAVRKLIKDARRGIPHAMYRLALVYEEGRLLPADGARALALTQAAAAAGYRPALRLAATYYFDDNAATQAES